MRRSVHVCTSGCSLDGHEPDEPAPTVMEPCCYGMVVAGNQHNELATILRDEFDQDALRVSVYLRHTALAVYASTTRVQRAEQRTWFAYGILVANAVWLAVHLVSR